MASWQEITRLQRAAGVTPSFNPDLRKECNELETVRQKWKGTTTVKTFYKDKEIVCRYDGAYLQNGIVKLSLLYKEDSFSHIDIDLWKHPHEVTKIN